MKIDIDDLISRLFSARETKKSSYDSKSYKGAVLYDDQKPSVERIIKEWYNDQVTYEGSRVAELEAKVYVYEQIIAKSNFAPMIPYITEVESGEVCPDDV